MLASVLVTSLVLAAGGISPAHVTLSTPAGHPQLLQGPLSAPITGDLVEGARHYVLAHRQSLGLPSTSSLGTPVVFGTRFGGSIQFPQVVGEIEVDAAKIVVTLNARREIVRVSSSLVPYRYAQPTFTLTAEEAMQQAALVIPGALLRPEGGAYGAWKRLMFRAGDEVRAGFLVFVPTLVMSENWFVAVDAATGEVLWTENRVKHAKANVYGAASGYSPGAAGVATAVTEEVELTHLSADRPNGLLDGDQIHVFNCCANEACNPEGSPRRFSGVFQYGPQAIPYDSVVCDRVQRAVEDSNGDFLFTPVDPPTTGTVSQHDPADSDPFVEVHAFHHVNFVYDYIRELSTGAGSLFPDDPRFGPFQMRDEREGRKPYVWTNLSNPNFYGGTMVNGTYVINEMVRQDNAAFLAKENFEAMPLPPEYMLDADTLLIYQGNQADFGYDAPVLWHEFGHGVIYSTANFRSFIVDERSGNDEGAAMHEGLADFIAGALGQNSRIGTYVGPRMQTGSALRDMANDYKCPSVLIGESHEDSQHFSAALWEARQQFMLDDEGRTYDAAIYAALVSMSPSTGFEAAGAILVDSIAEAFPDFPAARQTVQGIFDARGVTNCSKVLETTGNGTAVDSFYVGGRAQAGLISPSLVPAPYQIMRKLPAGASSVKVSARLFGGSQTTDPEFMLLAKSGAPVTFERASNFRVDHDAEVIARSAFTSGRTAAAIADIDVPCGGELYLAVANGTNDQIMMNDLSVTVTARDACEVTPEIVPPKQLDLAPNLLGKEPTGCTSTGALAGQLAGLLALTFALRRRRS